MKHFLKKDFKIIVPKKKELYFLLGIIFGETLLKKDFKIIVPKKKELFFWHSHQKESQSSICWYKVKNILHIDISSYIEPDTILWIFMGMPDGACANSWLRTVFTFAPMFAISFLDHQLQDPKTSLRHGLVALPVCKEHGSTAC